MKILEACFRFDELQKKVKNKRLLKILEQLCEEGLVELWKGITVYYSNGSYYVDNPNEDEVVEVETVEELEDVLKEYRVL
jgi:predicted NAD/FAD-dependent oxidoreductase